MFCLSGIHFADAQNNSREFLVRSTTGVAGSSENISSNNQVYLMQQSIGQTSAIGTFYSGNYISRQGFIQSVTPFSQNIISNHLPIEPLVLNLSVAIYPNPFTKNITLSFFEEVYGTVEVLVFDINGRIVFSKDYRAEEKVKVEFTNISSATYIIRVTANNKHVAKKIVKN